jgi:protein-tyrosine phosphatase
VWQTCPVEIVPVNPAGTLFVSGHIEDWEALRERGIDTIVDMDGDVDDGIPAAPNAILYVYHPILDDDLPDLSKIEALGRLVAGLVSDQHRVLVHCRMGFNRSVLVIATALTYLGMTGEQALEHVRGCRPGALFNETFAAHVLELPARRIRIDTL